MCDEVAAATATEEVDLFKSTLQSDLSSRPGHSTLSISIPMERYNALANAAFAAKSSINELSMYANSIVTTTHTRIWRVKLGADEGIADG